MLIRWGKFVQILKKYKDNVNVIYAKARSKAAIDEMGQSMELSFTFKADGVTLEQELVTVDQSAASTNWTEYLGATVLATEPDEVFIDLIMGKDATGTVSFDNIHYHLNLYTIRITRFN